MGRSASVHNPFQIDMIVYVLGKYVPDPSEPVQLFECKISHIKHKQFVAYRIDGGPGEWMFSKKHHNHGVFTDKAIAVDAYERSKRDAGLY